MDTARNCLTKVFHLYDTNFAGGTSSLGQINNTSLISDCLRKNISRLTSNTEILSSYKAELA